MKSLLNYIRKIDEDSSRQKIAKPFQNKNREIAFTKTKKYRKLKKYQKVFTWISIVGCTFTTVIAFPKEARADILINKEFNPVAVTEFEKSTLTIRFFNNNNSAANDVNVTDNLPDDVIVADPPNVANNSCGGTVTANAGASTVNIAGGTVPSAANGAAGECEFDVDVIAIKSGTFVNKIPAGTATSSQGPNALDADATLTVNPATPITGSKSFSPGVLHGNGSPTTMTITINNPNAFVTNNLGFTDNLPSELKVASPPNASTTCNDGTVTALADGTSVALSGATIGVNSSCTVTVNLAATDPNNYLDEDITNTIPSNGVTTDEGVTNSQPIEGTLKVQTGAFVSKTFSPATIKTRKNSTLTLTLRNFNTGAISGANLTDIIPEGVKVTALQSNSCNGTVDIVDNAGVNDEVQLTGGTIPTAPTGDGAGSCEIKVTVTADEEGNFDNEIPAGDFNGINYPGDDARLTVISPISLGKSISPSATIRGEIATATLTLSNDSDGPATITSFVDNLTTMGTGYTVASSPTPSTTCPGGTVDAPTGGTTVSMDTGQIPAGTTGSPGTCTITFGILVGDNAVGGNRRNRVPRNGLRTDIGNNSNNANARLFIEGKAQVDKAFSPDILTQTEETTLTITFTNTQGSDATITSFTDDLKTMGSGFVVSDSGSPTTTCAGGAVNVSADKTVITMDSGVIPAATGSDASGFGTCTVTVPIKVEINATTGERENKINIGELQTTLGDNALASTDKLTVKNAVVLSKAFFPEDLRIANITRLTITVTRDNAISTLTGIDLTDELPNNHTIASTPNLANSCGGTVDAPAGANTVTLTGGQLPPGSDRDCEISVDVLGPSTPTNATNTIPGNTLTTQQGATYEKDVTANVNWVDTVLTLNKRFQPTSIPVGGESTLQIIFINKNPNTINLTNVQLQDIFPLGMSVANNPSTSFSGSGCTGGTITANPGDTELTFNGGSIEKGKQCTLSVKITSNFAGNSINQLPESLVTSAEGVTNNNNPSATLTLLGTADIVLAKKDDGKASIPPGGSTTYIIEVRNSGPNNVAGIGVEDIVPNGMTINSWTCTATDGSICNEVSGTGNLNTTVDLANGGVATFEVEAEIDEGLTGKIKNTAKVTVPPVVNDPNSDNNEDSDENLIGSPNVLLVKRITAINGGTQTLNGNNLATYTDETDNPYDDNDVTIADQVNPTDPQKDTDRWPDGNNNGQPDEFLVGGVFGGKVKPDDELEYTIYFLSAGDDTAKKVLFCDRVPDQVTFVPNSFNNVTQTAGGLAGADRGILWLKDGNTESLTNVADGDVAQYFPPGVEPSTVYPQIQCGAANTNGAVVVNLDNLPNATAPGTPNTSYGYIRFRGEVK
ncbi:hypothetical protein NIES267_16640 [Calothrix parasitica NIES-267]|uniref:Uncharacterized protein n=1 Tax=Calothrix parasitica NIES-267 TaxID=1973488 RepID=A0A1Z4LLU9_9CYAN|nr:hypothetical protein NIES267_16640 [Calothrix parasitica NIES-267]